MGESRRFPVQTISGETVMVTDKSPMIGGEGRETQILEDENGRQYRPQKNGLRVVPLDSEPMTLPSDPEEETEEETQGAEEGTPTTEETTPADEEELDSQV